MSIQNWPGGVISKTPPTPSGPYETSTAPGVWTLKQATDYIKQGNWPTAGNIQPDPYFEYVTMLLHGDGTNGGQNNTFIDSSTNNFTITRNGNTTQGSFSPYGPNWSVSGFVASGGSLQAPSTAGNFGSADWTVEFWINTTSGDGPGIVTQATGGGAANTSWGFFVGYGTSKNVALYLSDGSSYFASITAGTSPVADGQWHHVAASRSGSTAYLFLDGVLQGTTSVGSTALGNGGVPVHIGGQGTGTSYMLQNGNISNVRIVKGTALYTSAFTPSTTPLTAISGTSLLTCQSNRFIDNSSNSYALTVNGSESVQRFSPFNPTSAYSTTTIGGSGYFDGSGDFLQLSSANAAFNMGTGNYTIEGWVYPQSFSGVRGIYAWRGNAVLLLGVNPFNGQQDLSFYDGSFRYGGFNIALNQWVHVAFVRNAGTATFFVNGVPGNSFAMSQSQDADFAPYVGSTVSAEDFLGYISSLRVVKGSALYTSAFTPPTTPPTTITNTSLLLNFTNAAIFDNAMMNDLETVGNAQISTSVVKFGTGSLYFDGSGDYLIGPNTPNMNIDSGNFTLEAWVYLSDATQVNPIVAKGFGAAGGYMLWVQSTLRLRVYDAGGASYTATSTGTIPNNTWTFVTGVRNGNTITLYINGTADGSVSYSGTSTNANPIEVGGYGTGTAATNGYIDDLRVTKGYARYTANFTPPTAAFPNL